jgi:lysozyme family protein
MRQNFERSLALVLKDEGGNVDDPDDHGGRTSRGVTQREYSAWLRENNRPNADVWLARDGDLANIYFEEYWQPYCDQWPTGVDYVVFDMNVNAGPYRSTTLIQRALHVREDGRIGPVTRGAILSTEPTKLIRDFSNVKRTWYRGLNQPKFTRGWLNRTTAVELAALKMIGGTIA